MTGPHCRLRAERWRPGLRIGSVCRREARRRRSRTRDATLAGHGMTIPPTLGLLLAGGLARRMGGGDKPLRLIAGRSILAHVVDRLGPQCDGLLINANGDLSRFADFGLPVVAD